MQVAEMNRLGLSLLTPVELVDEYATVVAEARALEERKKQLQELMDATGQTKLAGSINRVTIVTMPGAKMVMVSLFCLKRQHQHNTVLIV